MATNIPLTCQLKSAMKAECKNITVHLLVVYYYCECVAVARCSLMFYFSMCTNKCFSLCKNRPQSWELTSSRKELIFQKKTLTVGFMWIWHRSLRHVMFASRMMIKVLDDIRPTLHPTMISHLWNEQHKADAKWLLKWLVWMLHNLLGYDGDGDDDGRNFLCFPLQMWRVWWTALCPCCWFWRQRSRSLSLKVCVRS